MKGRMSNELGSIVIDPNVIATYAGSVAVECFGIVGMAIVNVKDGLVRLLKRDSLETVSYTHLSGAGSRSSQTDGKNRKYAVCI